MKSFRFVFISLLLLTNSNKVQANSCVENWWDTKEKIEELQKELICSNSDMSACAEALGVSSDSYRLEDPNTVVQELNKNLGCEKENQAGPIVVTPMSASFAAGAVKGVIDRDVIKRTFVNSADEFYYHMKLHKQRVVALAEEAYKFDPSLFEGVTKRQAVVVFSDHDNGKVLTAVLSSDGKPFYQELYEKGYGRRPPGTLIKELNKADEKFIDSALKRVGLVTNEAFSEEKNKQILAQRKAILKLEKYFDFTDRVYNKVSPEEFGRKMYPIKLSGDDVKYEKMLNHLRDNYHRVTKEIDYKPLSLIQKSALFAKLRTAELVSALASKDVNKLKLGTRALKRFALGTTSGIGAVLANQSLMKGMLAAELMTYSKNTGCSAYGLHDWYIDEHNSCKPVLGMGPEFSKYLTLPEKEQLFALEKGSHQCNVLNASFENQQVERFSEKKCNYDSLEARIAGENGVFKISRNPSGGHELNYSLEKGEKKAAPSRNLEVIFKYDENFESKVICFNDNPKMECFPENDMSKAKAWHRQMLKTLENKKQMYSYFLMKEYQSCMAK